MTWEAREMFAWYRHTCTCLSEWERCSNPLCPVECLEVFKRVVVLAFTVQSSSTCLFYLMRLLIKQMYLNRLNEGFNLYCFTNCILCNLILIHAVNFNGLFIPLLWHQCISFYYWSYFFCYKWCELPLGIAAFTDDSMQRTHSTDECSHKGYTLAPVI